MPIMNTRSHRGAVSAFLAASLLFAGGCDWLRGVSDPEEARVEINSDDVNEVVLVSSLAFIRIPDPECPDDPNCPAVTRLIEADTVTVPVPFNQTFRFNDRFQIFVQTYPAGDATATLSMRVSIDGEQWYNDFRLLSPEGADGEREVLEFAYQFKELGIDDIIVN